MRRGWRERWQLWLCRRFGHRWKPGGVNSPQIEFCARCGTVSARDLSVFHPTSQEES